MAGTKAIDVARWVPWLRDRHKGAAPVSAEGATPPTITFPASPLLTRVRIALGADLSQSPGSWAWEDITAYVRLLPGITTSQGRADETSTVQTSSASLTLDNTDGRFTRRNINSPYYLQLSQNTPIWIEVNAGTGWKTRFTGFVNAWPARWDISGVDATVPIACAGILRRLAQGSDAKSAMKRSLLASSPAAYWPLEDGAEATQAYAAAGASAISSFAWTNLPTFGATGPVGSAGAVTVLTANLAGKATVAPIGTGAVGTSWTWMFAVQGSPASGGWQVEFASVLTDSPLSPRFSINAGDPASFGHVNAVANFADGTGYSVSFSSTNILDGNWHVVRLTVTQTDATTTGFSVQLDDEGVFTSSRAGVTIGRPTGALLGPYFSYPDAGVTSFQICHMAVWTGGVPATLDFASAASGFAGEQAHTRMARLCTEDDVPFYCIGSTSLPVGPQPVAKLLDLIAQAEAVDQGVVYEYNWGLAYRTVAEFYNQPVGLALDASVGDLAAAPQPADDDQRLRNRWTVSRDSGSTATVELTTGRLGTGAGGPGLYDDSTTVLAYTDDQLPSQAGWRLHRDTIDEDRWPVISIGLHNSPDLIDTWCALPFGARVTVANPPTQTPAAIDQVLEGWSETWDDTLWNADLNLAPSSTYKVATIETGATVWRIDADGSTLAAACLTGDATVSAATTAANGLWTTTATFPADFPFDLDIGGYQATVSGIVGSSSPQTVTISDWHGAPAGVTIKAGATVKLWKPVTLAL